MRRAAGEGRARTGYMVTLIAEGANGCEGVDESGSTATASTELRVGLLVRIVRHAGASDLRHRLRPFECSALDWREERRLVPGRHKTAARSRRRPSRLGVDVDAE